MISKQSLLFLSALLYSFCAAAGKESSETSTAGGGLRGGVTVADPRMLKFTDEFPPRIAEYCNSDSDCPSQSSCGYWIASYQWRWDLTDRHKMCCPGGVDSKGICEGLDMNKNRHVSKWRVLGAPGDDCVNEYDCWDGHACAYWSPYDDKHVGSKRCCPSENKEISRDVDLLNIRGEYFCTDMSLETQCYRGNKYNENDDFDQGTCRDGMICDCGFLSLASVGNCVKP